nr:hypothetical protein CR513_13785 [Ipomoea trifida]
MIADFIAAGDQSGCALLSNAAIPLRCGVAIDVPDIMLKVAFPLLVLLSTENGQAARMLTPGPRISGLRIPGLALLGPLEENDATDGAVLVPINVPLNTIVAVGGEIMAAPPASFTVFPLSTLAIPPPLSHNTTFPFTSLLSNDPGPHRAASSSFAPGYTKGSKVGGKLWTWKADSPDNCSPFPSTAVALIVRSIVLAPTVRIHGASFDKVE